MSGGPKTMYHAWLLTWWILKEMKSRLSFIWTIRPKIASSVGPWSKWAKYTASKTASAKGIILKNRDLNLYSTWRPNPRGVNKLFVEEKIKSHRRKSELSQCFRTKSSQFLSLSKCMIQVRAFKLTCMESSKISKSASSKPKLKIQLFKEKKNLLKLKSSKTSLILSKNRHWKAKPLSKLSHKDTQSFI